MSALSPTVTAERPLAGKTRPGVVHGVHVACQDQQPVLVAVCGARCDPDQETPPTIEEQQCVVCLNPTRCPVCRSLLVSCW